MLGAHAGTGRAYMLGAARVKQRPEADRRWCAHPLGVVVEYRDVEEKRLVDRRFKHPLDGVAVDKYVSGEDVVAGKVAVSGAEELEIGRW